jgi:hypothetical protein|tara:strand:- start:47 stop:370 length:324 start_codon:yes stop_codon:yes gene_type:complete
MTFNYTKEMMWQEFEDATKKDQKGKKEKYDNRIKFLKEMKQLKKDNPSVMRDISINQKQFDNLINCWSAPNPRDAFYMSVFGRTYADQKAHEIKLYGLDKEERKESA